MQSKSNKKVLVSRLNHPVYISYSGESLMLSPRGRIPNINPELLGAIPKGVQLI